MSTESIHFSHDANARYDDKILALRLKHGWEGYGLFWALIERLRESKDLTSVKDYNIIAFDLRTSADKIKSIINDFGLFAFTEDGKRFYSERLSKKMDDKKEKSNQARERANKRWKNTNEEQQRDGKEDRSENISLEQLSLDNALEVENSPTQSKEKEFIPPTPEEVQEYCDERQNNVKGQAFCDYYQSNGWLVGKNKMKDWKAAVRNWERINKSNEQQVSYYSTARGPSSQTGKISAHQLLARQFSQGFTSNDKSGDNAIEVESF